LNLFHCHSAIISLCCCWL